MKIVKLIGTIYGWFLVIAILGLPVALIGILIRSYFQKNNDVRKKQDSKSKVQPILKKDNPQPTLDQPVSIGYESIIQKALDERKLRDCILEYGKYQIHSREEHFQCETIGRSNMAVLKKCARIFRSILGWLLIVVGGLSSVSGGICAFLALIGKLGVNTLGERMTFFATCLMITFFYLTILWLGLRLKNGGRKKTDDSSKKISIPQQENGSCECLDDVTFISGMRHIATPDGSWQQYDVILNATGYGWDMMKDWADYLSGADLEHISEVESGTMGSARSITQSYIDHGRKCTQTPELDVEQGMLSIAGMSRVLCAPVKVVWINQTNQLRLFTTVDNELTVKKYIETMVRRSFGTENAMKLGKPIAAPEKAPTPPRPAKASDQANPPQKPTEKAPEKPRLNLGTFSFSDADRQKLMALPKKGLPEKLDTAQSHIALLDALDAVMDTTVTRLKTTDFWKFPEGMPEDEKSKRIRANAASIMLTVNATLCMINPDFLRKKVEIADFDQLLSAWAVLNYYASTLKPQYTEDIRHFRDYIHHTLLTRYGSSADQSPVPAKLEGTGIYVKSAELLQWLKCYPLAGQYELHGVMPLTEKAPVITLYEDDVKTQEYRLQTENDEDFTGKYFLISVRMGIQGNPSVPVAQIDGFVSDTPEERNMTLKDIGYRMEGHFLACGGENTKVRQAMNRGQDLPMKALKYPGYITSANIRLVGICPDCQKSFCFHGYAFYMGQNDVAYSDDGLDCCQVSARNIASEDWKFEADGKTFRYYNSFCCPHCGTPYIDYRKFPENKKFGVSGCVHLGRKVYSDASNL